jgi:hypothetical protein
MTFALVFLGVAITISVIIVRIGSVALQMTGMDADIARFQALSAFTGAGFTTREAEDVVRHPQRRKIAATLILLGYAGIATVIAAVVQTVGARGLAPSDWILLVDLAGMFLAIYLFYRVIVWPRLSVRIDRQLAAGLRRGFGLTPAKVEELLSAAEGWGIVRFEAPEGCRFVNQTLGESRPRDQGMLVLALERNGELVPSPGRTTLILPGDILLAYGRLDQLEELMRESPEAAVCELPPETPPEPAP